MEMLESGTFIKENKMAILSGKIYHKINLNNFSIVDNKIVVLVDYYQTQEDREKEKQNTVPINEFLTKAKNFIEELQNEFFKLLKQNNLDPNIEVDDEKLQEILQSSEEIARKYSEGISFGTDFDFLLQKLVLGRTISFKPANMEKWKELGLNEEWLTESASKLGTMKVELCEYIGQNITPEFLYTELKKKINNAVDC